MHSSISCFRPVQSSMLPSRSFEKMSSAIKTPPTEFPPPGYRPTPINHLLVNALDLTAPASDALLKNRKNAWVQVAGHPDSFAPASDNTIWKKRLSEENYETVAYHALMNDVVKDIVPKFHREVEYGGKIFIEIEDLLQHFTDPSIMDIKMGTRTFLECEVKNPALRKDLYDKMIKLDATEPTEKEHQQEAITKLRYMQFRERDSSTSTLGFRVEAWKMSGEVPNTDLKKIKTEHEVKQLICQFLQRNKDIQKTLLKRFKEMRRKISASKYFKHHEMIGSSILILYDQHKRASAWMIDFAKTLLVDGCSLNHRALWEVGNHEDGYLTGIDNLIRIFSELDLDISDLEKPADQSSRTDTPHLHNHITSSCHLHNNDSSATSVSHHHGNCTRDTPRCPPTPHPHSDSSLDHEENSTKRRKSQTKAETPGASDRNDNVIPRNHSLPAIT